MATLAHLLTALIAAGGYPAILALMALESACLPLPSEIIMPFAGYLAATGRFSLAGVALAGALGCNLGSALAYWLGAHLGRDLILHHGRYLLISPHDLTLAERFFARFGAPSVFLGRLLPVIRTFIALPAGIGRMRQLPFHLYTFLGSLPWCLGLAYAGARLGVALGHATWLATALHIADALVLLALLTLLALFFSRRMQRRRTSTDL